MARSPGILRLTLWALLAPGAVILWLAQFANVLYVAEDGRVFGVAREEVVWSAASRKSATEAGVTPGWQPGGSLLGRGRLDVPTVHRRLHGWSPMASVSLWFVLGLWTLLLAAWIAVWLRVPQRRSSLKARVSYLSRTAETSHWTQSARHVGTRAWLAGLGLTAASYLCGFVWVDSAKVGRVYCVMGGELAWTPRTDRPSQWVPATWVWAPGQQWGPGAETYLRRTTPFGGDVIYTQRISLAWLVGQCGLVVALLWGVRWVATKSVSGRRCTHCDYELTGTPAGLPCPECGRPIEPAQKESSERAPDRLPPKD